MWPFRKKRPRPIEPELHDQALLELSQLFLHDDVDPTPGSDLLDLSRFDYSIESLAAMDEHLERMRPRELSGDGWTSLILRAGAYVGEVIRRHTVPPRRWNWLAYEQAAALFPTVASERMSIGTAAVLWDRGDAVTFPL